jgi:hypothetical protein
MDRMDSDHRQDSTGADYRGYRGGWQIVTRVAHYVRKVMSIIEDNTFLIGMGVDGCGNMHMFLEPNRNGIFDDANYNADAIIWRIINGRSPDLNGLAIDNLRDLHAVFEREIAAAREHLLIRWRLIDRRNYIVERIAEIEREREAEEALRAARAAGLNIELGQDVAAIRAHFARAANPEVERIAREEVARATRDGDEVQEWAIAVGDGAMERERREATTRAAAPHQPVPRPVLHPPVAQAAAAPQQQGAAQPALRPVPPPPAADEPNRVLVYLRECSFSHFYDTMRRFVNGHLDGDRVEEITRQAYRARANELIDDDEIDFGQRQSLAQEARRVGLDGINEPRAAGGFPQQPAAADDDDDSESSNSIHPAAVVIIGEEEED